MLDFPKLTAAYQEALLQQVVPFWLTHSRDTQCGGYFDALSNTGESIDADKTVLAQAQQIWAFAWLHNTFDAQPAWLDHALHGGLFLSQYAHDETLNCYSLVDRRGRPVAPAVNVIPDAYAVMAYSQLHLATGNDEWAMLAKQVLLNLLHRRHDQRITQSRTLGGFRQWQHIQEPIAVLKALQATKSLLSDEDWKEHTGAVVDELLTEFLDKRLNILREFILPDGAFSNTPQGRRLSPGLTFEAANVLLDIALQTGNRKLMVQVVSWSLSLCEWAWDEAHSGLHQYVDFHKKPGLDTDWQQRWAWVHLEALAVLIKSFFHTHHPDCPRWFQRIHDYTFQHFPDLTHTGWHLVIDQEAKPLLSVKAMPSAGCYYYIKSLSQTASFLTQCAHLQPSVRKFRLV